MRNRFKVAIWSSWTPEQFLLHVGSAVHVCKQIGLDTNYANATIMLEAAYCKLDAMKTETLSWQTPQKEGKKKERKGCESTS